MFWQSAISFWQCRLIKTVRFSVHAGLLMVLLEAFELRDHDLAGRDQRVLVLVREGARHKDLGKARIGVSFLGRIVRSSDDQVVNYFSGLRDALG